MAWLGLWAKRIPITLGTITGSLTNFPMFVKLDYTNAPNFWDTILPQIAPYAMFDNFEAAEGYSTGNINGQNGWTTYGTSGACTVATDQYYNGSRSLKIVGNSDGTTYNYARKQLTPSNNGSIEFYWRKSSTTGTCYFNLFDAGMSGSGNSQILSLQQTGSSGFRLFEYAKFASIQTSVNSSGLIKINSTAHGMATGDTVKIVQHTSGTGANNTDARRTWTITVVDVNSFTLNSSTYVMDGTGGYVQGQDGAKATIQTLYSGMTGGVWYQIRIDWRGSGGNAGQRVRVFVRNTTAGGEAFQCTGWFRPQMWINANGVGLVSIDNAPDTGASDAVWVDKITPAAFPFYRHMAITTGDGQTKCYAEIVRVDIAAKELFMYVRVPSASTGGKLYLYYDIAQSVDGTYATPTYIGDTEDTCIHNVWDSNYLLVHHAQGTKSSTNSFAGRTTLIDSTSNERYASRNTAGNPPQRINSNFGWELNNAGTANHHADIADDAGTSGLANLTAEILINVTSTTLANAAYFTKYGSDGNREFALKASNGGTYFNWYLSSATGTDTGSVVVASDAAITTGVWYYLAGRGDGTADLSNFFVGKSDTTTAKQAASGAWTWALENTASPTRLMSDYSSQLEAVAAYAEFRLSNIARSDAWLEATFNNYFKSSFLTYSAYENYPKVQWDTIASWGIRTKKVPDSIAWKMGVASYYVSAAWKIISSKIIDINWKVGWWKLQQAFSWKILKQLFATASWKIGVITKEDDITWWIKKAPGLSGWLKRIPIEVAGTVTGEHVNFPLFIKLDNNNAPDLWSTLCPTDAPYGLDKVFDNYTVGALAGQDVNAANPDGWVTGGRPETTYFQIYTNSNAGSDGNTNHKTLRIQSYDLITTPWNYARYNFNNSSHIGSIEFAVNFPTTSVETHARIELRESDGIGTVVAIESDMDRILSVEYPSTFSLSHGSPTASVSWFKFRIDWRGKEDLTNQEMRIFLKKFTLGNSKGYWEQVAGWFPVTWNANGINQIHFQIGCSTILFLHCDDIKYQTYPRHLDMLVTTGDGATPCYTELVRVDRDSKQMWLYTKVPNFKQGTRLYLYYDKNSDTIYDDINNPLYMGETGQSAAVSTWDAGFHNVYHMASKGEEIAQAYCIGDSIHPTVGAAVSGIFYNEDDVWGAVTQPTNGSAATWNAGSGSGNSRDTFTAELLVKTTALWANTTQIFQRGNYALSDARAYHLTEDASGHLNLIIANSSGQDSAPYVDMLSNDVLSLNDWWYIAIRGDNVSGKANIFMGKATTSPSSIKQANEGTFNWSLKNLSNAVEWAYRLYGNSTELRVSNVARSDEWLQATFSNLINTNFLSISSTEPSAPLQATDVAWKVGVHVDQSILLWAILGKITNEVSWRIFNAIPERIDQLVEWGIKAGKMDEIRWGIASILNNDLKWKIGWGELAVRIGWRINFILTSTEFLQRIHLSTTINILNSNLLVVANESVYGINALLRTTCETPFKIGYEVLIKQYELLNKLGSWFVLQSTEIPNTILEYVKVAFETLNNITEQLKQENRIDEAILSTQLVTITNRLLNIIESEDINENAMAFDISSAKFYVDGEDITDYVSDGDISISESDYVNTVSLNLTNLDLYYKCQPSKLDKEEAKTERIVVVITRDSVDYTYKFLLEERDADQQVAEDSFTIWGRSRAAILDEPYWRKEIVPGVEIKETYLSGGAKSIIQQILADTYAHYNNIAPITLTFNIDDYIVPDQIFSIKDKSPIACIQELAEAGGGIVRSGKNNELIIRYQYPMDMKNSGTLTSLAVNHDFDDYEDIITMSDSYTPPTGYNAVYVTGKQDEGADLSGDFVIDSIHHPDGSFDIIDGEHEDAWLRLYLVPLISESDYEIEETNGTGIFMGEYEEQIEDEYITVTGETAQTNRVITSGFTYEWVGDQAGTISVTEDNNNQLTVSLGSGYVGGVIKCSYKTKYHLWKFQGITVDVVATFAVRQIEQVI